MNICPTIVVRTTAKEGRYATLGVARLAKTNEEMIESGLSRDKTDLLPWALFDGINEKGLVVNHNVVSRKDWGEKSHTGTKDNAPELNVLCITRLLLDKCATVQEALECLRKYNITPLKSKNMNLHFMISDPNETYVVEFINNEIVAEPRNIMTNYHLLLKDDSIPANAMGVERYDTLNQYYKSVESMEDMWNLMKRVRYTNSYIAENRWYSEIASSLEIDYPYTSEDSSRLKNAVSSTEADWAKEKEKGVYEGSEWWDTVHNSIYDISNKKLWVTVHEWDKERCEFNLFSYNN